MDKMDGILNHSDKWWCQDELLGYENMEEAANLILQSPSAVENYAMFRNDSHQMNMKPPNEMTATFTVPRSLDQTFNQMDIQWKIGELVLPNNGKLKKLQIFVPFEKNGEPAFLNNAISSVVSIEKIELKPSHDEVTESVKKDATEIRGDCGSKIQPEERDIEIQPEERDIKIQPEERDIKIQPEERDIEIQPEERDIKIQPEERDIKIQPEERDIKIQPEERYLNISSVIEAIYDPIEVIIKQETDMDRQYENQTRMPSTEMNKKPVLKNTRGTKRKQGFTTRTEIKYGDLTPQLSPLKGLPYEAKLPKPIPLAKSTLAAKTIKNDNWDIDEPSSWNSSESGNTKTLKPYNFFCQFCSAGFDQNYKIKNHVKIHTGKIVYKCMCGKCGVPYRDFRTMTRYHNAIYK